MRHPDNLKAVLLSIFVVLAMLSANTLTAAPPPTQGVHITPIGNPTWKPVDFHLFSAPIGSAPDYAEFATTALSLLPPPNHVFHPQLLVGPGAPHAGPYDSELAEGVAALGFHEGVRFRTAEFSNGMGIFVVFMVVPTGGAQGSSPDSASGPIIPNALFPIDVSSYEYHNGKLFSLVAIGSVPALNDPSLNPSFAVQGHSHFPFFLADAAEAAFVPGTKLNGSYEMRTTIVDQTGNGWMIRAHFTITP